MQFHSDIAALGGFGNAKSDVDFPEWFEAYKGGYAIGDDSINSGILPEGFYLTGAGMVIRKKLYSTAFENLPSLFTDRVGKQLSSGGDTEICLRFLLMGYQLYYDKNLTFIHFIPKERLTEEYRDRLFCQFKSHSQIMEFYKNLLLQ